MDLRDTITECAEITKAHGFATDQHATQLALIVTEVAEAMECVNLLNPADSISESVMLDFCNGILAKSYGFEAFRKSAKHHEDNSIVVDQDHLNEELADIVIRVCSYVGGNGQTDAFLQALAAKIEKNRNRPYLHGKGF
ncbi:hypothetical protein [Oryzomonas rubra]|uniref:Uncharacterized protein n=1 Tax=Oryzomonas rubra TaxID=2509454 RepID=A0A5A9X7U3_9BACT|nr:hypothetical protein [Oryzomonas rubra]KAA0888723.1 hypothetical protein ET418_15190 [Oryzomonas rubra]